MNIEEKLIDYLDGNLAEEDRPAVEAYLRANPELMDDLRAMGHQLSLLPNPKPSAELRQNFYQNLSQWKQQEQGRKSIWQHFAAWWKTTMQPSVWPQLTIGVCLLFIGGWVGYQMRGNEAMERLEGMTAKMEKLEKMTVLSMLEQDNAGKRIQAVSMASNLINTDQQVLHALFLTLSQDDNDNVRMVAADALSQYIHIPAVRQQLIKAITAEKSPLVQLALVDALLSDSNKQSIEALQGLLKDEGTHQSIKAKVKQELRQLPSVES